MTLSLVGWDIGRDWGPDRIWKRKRVGNWEGGSSKNL